MAYEVECGRIGCEFATRTETEQDAIDTISQHTDEKHANMDISDEEIRENITHIE